VLALCVTMCASCLKYFPTHLQAIRDLLLHCTSALQPTSIEFLKTDALQDELLRRNRFYHSWTAMAQCVWRETTDEKWKN